MPKIPRTFRVLATSILALLPALAHAWGEQGHIYINQVAAGKVPSAMPAFLKAAAQRIAYWGPEPDRWRDSSTPTLSASQDSGHFIDLERISWLADPPKSR